MQLTSPEHHQLQLLTVEDVGRLLCISRSSVWAKSRDEPDFPKSFKISPGATRWKQSDVRAFIESKVATKH